MINLCWSEADATIVGEAPPRIIGEASLETVSGELLLVVPSRILMRMRIHDWKQGPNTPSSFYWHERFGT